MTKREENGVTVLVPADGMRLTDGETVADGEVYLGVRDAAYNWSEVTVAEAERVLAEREAEGDAP